MLLVVFLPVLAKARGESSLFQTALPTDKSSYKLGETVEAMLVLYNPTSQRIAVHFPNGCWFSFIIRSLSGDVVHNETMRSEERRVGKECRSRSRRHYANKEA